MKRNVLLLILFQLSFLGFAQKTETERKALAFLKKYNEEGYIIIKESMSVPSKYKFGTWRYSIGQAQGFDFYINGKSEEKIIGSLGTVVHEMTHSYAHRMVFKTLQDRNIEPKAKQRYLVIHIKDKESILIEESNTFPSRELVKVIPERLRTFRFKTYINTKKKILGTQQSGIYGLLDEFSAYYHDSKTSYNLYQYYIQETSKSNKDYLDYMSDFNSTFYAYAEFKYYILKYLILAQKKYSQIYADIISNSSFKEAFLKTEAMYSKLIEDYFARNKKIADELRSKGVSVRFEEKYTWIGNSGIGNFMEEYTLLKTELEKSEYVDMMKILKSQ